MTISEIREKLLVSDADFQKLAEAHARYSTELDQITRSPFLSAEDLQLETELKRRKLRLKDEMQRRLAQFRQAS